jgi:hypothetical protein
MAMRTEPIPISKALNSGINAAILKGEPNYKIGYTNCDCGYSGEIR